LQEHIENERQTLGISKYGEKFRFLPKETDSVGTAIRMRPETPKINLLEIQQRQHQRQVEQMMALYQQQKAQQRYGMGYPIKLNDDIRRNRLEPLPQMTTTQQARVWIEPEETKAPRQSKENFRRSAKKVRPA
jgi:hypothetical protein